MADLPCAELADERLALMFSRGRDAEPEIRDLNKRLDALAAGHGSPDDPDLFAAMADMVDECAALEREAVVRLATPGRSSAR